MIDIIVVNSRQYYYYHYYYCQSLLQVLPLYFSILPLRISQEHSYKSILSDKSTNGDEAKSKLDLFLLTGTHTQNFLTKESAGHIFTTFEWTICIYTLCAYILYAYIHTYIHAYIHTCRSGI